MQNAIRRFKLYVGGNGTHLSGQEMYASAAYEHPRYDPRMAHAYDFMVLKLPERFQNIPFVEFNTDPSFPTNATPLTVVDRKSVV